MFALLASCVNSHTGEEMADLKGLELSRINDTSRTRVKIAKAQYGIFSEEIISNGTMIAENKSEVRFLINETIDAVYVRNGQKVNKGELLAELDASNLSRKLARLKDMLNRSYIELDDRLIDYGYRLKDTLSVPGDILKMAKIKSNHAFAHAEVNEMLIELSYTRITAPISGRIADVEARPFNRPDLFKRLCTIINEETMVADFNVMESEYRSIKLGQKVEVSSFDQLDRTYKGEILNINPKVGDGGMIKVKARVYCYDGYLLDGMSVKIKVNNAMPGKLYVPKEALLHRQNKEVIFTYENKKAKWNYVESGLKNSAYVVINKGINKDAYVIIANNLNLSHGTSVEVEQ